MASQPVGTWLELRAKRGNDEFSFMRCDTNTNKLSAAEVLALQSMFPSYLVDAAFG